MEVVFYVSDLNPKIFKYRFYGNTSGIYEIKFRCYILSTNAIKLQL